MNQVDKVLEDETIDVEYLLVEPPNDQASVDCVLHFDKTNLKMEDVPCIYGGSNSKIIQEGEDMLKNEVIDLMVHKVEEENFQATNGISNACEDYLLDLFSENVINLDPEPSKSNLNSISQNQYPRLNSSNSISFEVSDSSTANFPLPECSESILDKATYEFHGIHSFACTLKLLSEDESDYPFKFDSQNVHLLEDFSSMLPGCMTSGKNDKDINFLPESGGGSMPYNTMTWKKGGDSMGRVVESGTPSGGMSCNESAILTEKRLHKPTQRYIDELSNSESRSSGKKLEASTLTVGKRSSGHKYYKDSHMGSQAMKLFPDDESSAIAIQVPFGSPVQKESQKWKALKVQLDEGASPPRSDDNCVTAVGPEKEVGRRKHHRPWTVSEVRKLIDGVSQYGVGKWSHIKKLLFPSSAHRTPVDLKDKWRNLLKTSSVLKQGKKEDENNRTHTWRPLPKSILRRVNELACMYPYPGGHKSKVLRVCCTSYSSTLLSKLPATL